MGATQQLTPPDKHPTEPTGQLSRATIENRRLGRWALLALALIIAGIALIFGVGWAKYRRLRPCLDSSLTRLHNLEKLMRDGITEPRDSNLMDMGVQLEALQADLFCLRTEVREFLPFAPTLSWLPEVGPDIASAPVLLDMAQSLVDGGMLVYDGMYPLIERIESNDLQAPKTSGPDLDLSQVLAVIDAAQPSLLAAKAKLSEAEKLYAELTTKTPSPRVSRLLDLTQRYLPLMRAGVEVAQITPELLGAKGTQTYLILAQNDDERRPTGGWITGMGLISMTYGEVTSVIFRDSWAVDNLQVPHDVPPQSMMRTLWAGIWLFRDANWSPDFPTSARVAEQILQRDQGVAVDGVIAVDQQALELLVAGLEPLSVRGVEEPITKANVLTYIREAWTEPEEGLTSAVSWRQWTTHRKDFMSDLVEAMLNKVQSQHQSADLGGLARAIVQGLQERHILIYLDNARAGRLLASQHWNGALLDTQGDYLQVVDANVGFNKVDPSVERTITYEVDLAEPARFQSKVVVGYHNKSQRAVETCLQGVEWLPSYEERMHGCYWNYVRFYVPEGSRLLTSEREPLPPGSLLSRYRFAPLQDAGPDTGPTEKGKSVFGLFFVLGPGKQRDVRLTWQLPAGIVQTGVDGSLYRLLVQKQSGTSAIPLRVRIALPPRSRVVAATPEPSSMEVNCVVFDLSLDKDQHITILYQDGNVSEP